MRGRAISLSVNTYIAILMKASAWFDIFNDDFLGIIREGEVDFGFGEGRNRYSYVKNND